MTTFKTGSILTTGTAVGDTQPGFLITFGSDAGAGTSALNLIDYFNAPIFVVVKLSNGQIACYGDYLSAFNNVISGSGIRLNGIQSPACITFPDGDTNQGLYMWSGTGVPGASTVDTARVGDLYARLDTPTTSNQRLYQCTVAGSPGTWTARY